MSHILRWISFSLFKDFKKAPKAYVFVQVYTWLFLTCLHPEQTSFFETSEHPTFQTLCSNLIMQHRNQIYLQFHFVRWYWAIWFSLLIQYGTLDSWVTKFHQLISIPDMEVAGASLAQRMRFHSKAFKSQILFPEGLT